MKFTRFLPPRDFGFFQRHSCSIFFEWDADDADVPTQINTDKKLVKICLIYVIRVQFI